MRIRRRIHTRYVFLAAIVLGLTLINIPYWFPQLALPLKLPPGLYVSATSPPTGILHAVAISLTNTQSSSIAAGAQISLDINWTEWNQYSANDWAASNLQNVMFYDSEGSGTGQPLNAYLEACSNATIANGFSSACGYQYTHSTIWLKLNATGIPSTTQITIYLGFFATTTNNFLSTANGCTDCWGENPLITQSDSASLSQSNTATSSSATSLSDSFTARATSGTIVVATTEYASAGPTQPTISDNASDSYTNLVTNCPGSPIGNVCSSLWDTTFTAPPSGPTLVQASYGVSLATPFTISLSGVTIGDTIIVTTTTLFGCGSTISDSITNSFSAVESEIDSDGYVCTQAWEAVDKTTSSDTITITPFSGTDVDGGAAYDFSGMGAYVTAGTNAGESGTSLSAGSFTPTSGETVFLVGSQYNSFGPFSTSSPFSMLTTAGFGKSGGAANINVSCSTICAGQGDAWMPSWSAGSTTGPMTSADNSPWTEGYMIFAAGGGGPASAPLKISASFSVPGAVSLYIYDISGITTSSAITAKTSATASEIASSCLMSLVPNMYQNGFTIGAIAVSGDTPVSVGSGYTSPTGSSGSNFGNSEYNSAVGASSVSFGCSNAIGPNWAESAVTFLPSSNNYGEYDNGAYVFNFYYNFNGTSLPSYISALNVGSGVTTSALANGYQIRTNEGSTANGIQVYDSTSSTPQVAEYVANFEGSYLEDFGFGYETALPSATSSYLGFTSAYISDYSGLGGSTSIEKVSSGTPTSVGSCGSFCYNIGTSLGWPSTGHEYAYNGHATTVATATDSSISSTSSYIGFGLDQNPNPDGNILVELQVLRTRTWVPGDPALNTQVLGDVISESAAQAYGTGGTNLGQQLSEGAPVPIRLDSSTYNGCYATSCSASLTTSSSNDLILVWGNAQGGSYTPTVTASGLSFTSRFVQTSWTNGYDSELWYAVASTKLSGLSITVTDAGSGCSPGCPMSITAIAISNANTANPFDPNGALPSSDIEASPQGAYSTSNANDFIAFFVANAGGQTPTFGLYSFTTIQAGSGSGLGYAAAYKIVSSVQSSANYYSATSGGTALGVVDAIQQAPPAIIEINQQAYGTGGTNLGQQLSNSIGGETAGTSYGTGVTNNGQQLSEGITENGIAFFANTQPIKISNSSDVPAGSAPSIVQSHFNYVFGVTSITDAFANPTTKGNTIVVIVGFFYGATVSVADSQLNNFTSQVLYSHNNAPCGGGIDEEQIWTATAKGTTADVVTFTSSVTNYPTMSIYELAGVTTPTTSTGYACGGGTAVTSFPVGTSGIVLAGWNSENPTTATASAHYTTISSGSQYGNGEYSSTVTGSTTASASTTYTSGTAEAAITFSAGPTYPNFSVAGPANSCPNTPSPSSVVGNSAADNIATNSGCVITITAPSGYHFTPSDAGIATLTVCSTLTCGQDNFTYAAGAPSSTLVLLNFQDLSIQYLSSHVQTSSSATVLNVDANSVFTVLGSSFNGQFTMAQNNSAIYQVPSQFGNGIQIFSSISLSRFNYTNAQPNPYLNMTGTGATIQVLDPSASTGMAYLSTIVAGNSYTPTVSQNMIQVSTSGSQNVLMYFQRPGGCPSCGGQTTVVTQTFTSSTTSTVVGGVPFIDNVQINVPPNSAYTKLVQLVIDSTGVSLNSQLTALGFKLASNTVMNYNYSELPISVPSGETGSMPVLFQTSGLNPGTYVIQGSATFVQQTGSYIVGFKITIVVSAHPVVGGFDLVSWLLAWWWIAILAILVVLGIGLYIRQNG